MRKSSARKGGAEVAATAESSSARAIRAYGAGVIAERLEQMLAQMEGVLERDGTEPVHQMRVWSRRSRAALDVFAACFPGKPYADLELDVKTVTGALGEARDVDVSIVKLEKLAAGLPAAERAGVEAFIAELVRRRSVCQREVAKVVRRLKRRDLLGRFGVLAGEVDSHGSK